MRSALDDRAVIENQDQVGVADGAQPVGKHDPCTGQLAQMLVDQRFGDDIQLAGRFVEEQDRRRRRHSPSERQALALPAGQCAAAFAYSSFIAHRHLLDIVMNCSASRRLDDLVQRQLWGVEPDIASDGAAQQEWLLQYYPKLAPQCAQVDLACEDIVGLSIGTRPDCVPDPVLDLLAEYAARTYLWLELGLESAHDHSLVLLNRGHTVAAFDDAVQRAQQRQLRLCAHVILGLPGETIADMLATMRHLAALHLDAAKLHHEFATARDEFRAALKRVMAFHLPAATDAQLEAACRDVLNLLN
jgi:hypothetical protein